MSICPLVNPGRPILVVIVLLVGLWACEGAPPGSTLVQPGQSANPPAAADALQVSASRLFDDVIARARHQADAHYDPPAEISPAALSILDYDQYRAVRFRPEAAIWRDLARFEIQLFHPGFVHRQPVRVNVIEDGAVVSLPFDPALFRYDEPARPPTGANLSGLGYAGFRVHYPLNNATYKDEVVVFLGASYFRLLGRGHVYGLSSRGLAIGTGLPRAEEFPAFREFWLRRPAPNDDTVTIHALLDGPSVTGAYQFVLTPGAPTTMDVEARVFARRAVDKLGVAPMSSMFLYGPNRIPMFDDFRPQVHDSDGLLVHTADDEWIWRPLSNGPGVQVSALAGGAPQGFGLVQRERRFDGYLDVEASYHRRPSAWIEPRDGDWGPGRVELLAYASVSEFNDNIAAYWVPDDPVAAGDELSFRYRITMFDDRLATQTLAQVVHTRIGWDALPGEQDPPPRSQRRFVVDFRGGEPSPSTTLDGVLETTTGEVSDLVVHTLPDEGGWRASFRLMPEGRQPAEMRLYLVSNQRRVTETWSYIWYPDHVVEE